MGTQAVALLSDKLKTSQAFKHMLDIAREWGVDVRLDRPAENWYHLMANERNVWVWGQKLTHKQYIGKGNRNLLFCENGLVNQNAGCYTNLRGYFGDSSIPANKEWEQIPTQEELDNLDALVKESWGIKLPAMPTFRPKQVVLVALQVHNDAPVIYYYPTKPSHRDGISWTLELCKKHLPRGPLYLFRVHPKQRDRFSRHWWLDYKNSWRDDFTLDVEGGLYEKLPYVSHVITVNSTTAGEALCWGLPVCTLGRSIFYGSDVFLDRSANPEAMQDILQFQPDMQKSRNYLCALLRHQLSYTWNRKQVETHPDFLQWCSNASKG